MSYLTLRNISKKYGALEVLKSLHLDVEEGTFTTLLGPSGCGKSTLLRQIAGIEAPDTGEIFIDEVNITNLSIQKRNIGLVFQNYALFPNLSIFENVAFGLRYKKVDEKVIQEKVNETLAMVHLESKANNYPHQLSGGQKQRVSLARALILEPKILLLDEPLSALDAKVREKLRAQIKKIQRQLQLTVIFVTHDQEEALSISDRIIIMNNGVIEQDGTPKKVYDTPKSEFVATFIGNYNILDKEVYNELFTQKIEGSKVVIKPESIHFDDEGLEVEVRESYLLGNIIRYECLHHDVRLKIDCLNNHRIIQRHEKRFIKVKTEEVIVL